MEWKRSETVKRTNGATALETSLVEWKRSFGAAAIRRAMALETSLVEWKRLKVGWENGWTYFLGNFLSGMETCCPPAPGCAAPPLETSLVEWKRAAPHTEERRLWVLGNFLSGMETILLEVPPGYFEKPWKLP